MSLRTTDLLYRNLAEVMTATFPDRDLPQEVGPHTRIFADIGMASIELVVLGERLEQYFGKRLPFGPFLASLRDAGAEDLELGDLVEFLQQHV